jgi:hypothetical protein
MMRGGSQASRQMAGQPLFVFAAVLGGWIVLRVLLWQSPFAAEPASVAQAHRPAAAPTLATKLSISSHAAPPTERTAVPEQHAVPPLALELASPARTSERLALGPASAAVAQPWLPAASVAPTALPMTVTLPPSQRGPVIGNSAAIISRWSADAWLLLRKGSGTAPVAVGPSYGRSQAGAVLRYRLAPASAHRPVAYARITRALAGVAESELAAGIAGRPLSGMPVSFAAEVRFRNGPGGREVRPAAYAVTELPPVSLPLGLRGDAYAQAGYVGGRFATAFVDGQARIDAPVARLGGAELRAGGGAWGGAQKGAARLDVGPSAALGFAIGKTRSRLAFDYRFRVAGAAAPGSGPSLTISAGF